jgi:pimeloyl-ACP methyl ester carboxylesterase
VPSFACWRCLVAFFTVLAGAIWPPERSYGWVGGEWKEPDVATATTIEIRDGLAISGINRNRRAVVSADPVNAKVVTGTLTTPKSGDALATGGGQVRHWELVKAGLNGSFPQLAPNAYLASTIAMDRDDVLILKASGHNLVYVNGEPRVGDIYATGYGEIPVLLRKGLNSFLFQLGRQELRCKLTAPKAPVFLNTGDVTLPDVIIDESINVEGAIVVVNATPTWRDDLAVSAAVAECAPTRVPIPVIAPLSVRKAAFTIRGARSSTDGASPVRLTLERRDATSKERWDAIDTASISLRVRQPAQVHKRTFRSEIDGSIQYYSIVPPVSGPFETSERRPGLVLSLHGAAVEAIGHAESYSPKPDLYIIAPTNRRPYGFDWEDWGRLDAIEVLELTQRAFDTDRRHTYLTGHSMGGHGTWHMGMTFPDKFAAIAPSAGWISFWSYGGARRVETTSPLQEIISRAMLPSDTLALLRNASHFGVYVLHGDADDNVPVSEARQMRRALGEFHPDFAYHEQPAAGHWWGNACVDWPPLFEFLRQHSIPTMSEVRQLDFVTASPAISHRAYWASIEAPLKWMSPSTIHLGLEPEARRFRGTTQNVARLALAIDRALPAAKDGEPISFDIDGQKIAYSILKSRDTSGDRHVGLVRSVAQWSVVELPEPRRNKGPHRMGPFKEAFRNRFVFVVPTRGTSEENAVAFATARYDAETFWYRGNGSVEVIPDTVWIDPGRAEAYRERNVILYGHSESNGAWASLLSASPVQVQRGKVRIGTHMEFGDDLACVFLRPRPGSDVAVVGVVAGSGTIGQRLTHVLPFFSSGVEYPDCLLLGANQLAKGASALVAAGYFGSDWSVEAGEFVWHN